jgi:excisionase family DNA binding protein
MVASAPETGTVSVRQAAARLGVCHETVYDQIRAGRFPIPVIRVGKRILIPAKPLERIVSGEGETAGAAA